jgi:O-antigen/teichoic acid export membrane protein
MMQGPIKNHATAPKHIPFAQVLKLAGVSGFGDVFQQGIRMVTNIIITRTIGASAYGLFSLGMTVVNMGAIAPRFGLPQGITRFVAYYRGKGEAEKVPLVLRQALLISLCLGTATAILIYLLAPYIASAVFHREELSSVLRWLALFIPFGISGMVLLGTLRGLKQIGKQVMIQDFIWPLVYLVLVVIFFLMGWRLYALVAAAVLAVVVRFAVSFAVVRGQVSLRKPGHVQLPINKLLFFSAPLFLANVLGFSLNWTDTLMLGYFREPAEVGVYAIAWRLSLFVSFPLAAFATIFNPMAAEYVGKGDNASLNSLLQTTNQWILLFSLPLAILLFSFPKEVMSIFGREFTGGAWVVLLLVAGQLVNAASGPCGNVLMVKGWTGLNLINSAAMAIVNLILNFLMIPRWGMLGAALASSFSLAMVNILRVLEIRVFLKINPYTLGYLKPLFCGLIAALPLVFLRGSSPLMASLLFIALYGALAFTLDIQGQRALNNFKKIVKDRRDRDET